MGQPNAVEFTKDNIELSKKLKELGDQVQIQSRINGREWQGKDGITKWFTSINGYKISVENSDSQEDPSSSFDTYDEYADDLKMMCFKNKLSILIFIQIFQLLKIFYILLYYFCYKC